MGHRIHADKEDYAQLDAISPLMSAFSRAVQQAVANDPESRQKVKAASNTHDDAVLAEINDSFQSYADHQRYYKADHSCSINNLLTYSLKNHFMQIVRRAVADEQLAAYVPAALATESNADLLDKYKLRDMASVVRAASVPSVKAA